MQLGCRVLSEILARKYASFSSRYGVFAREEPWYHYGVKPVYMFSVLQVWVVMGLTTWKPRARQGALAQ